jgi:hypothetical protein
VDFVTRRTEQLSRVFSAYDRNFDINFRKATRERNSDDDVGDRLHVKQAVQRGIWALP